MPEAECDAKTERERERERVAGMGMLGERAGDCVALRVACICVLLRVACACVLLPERTSDAVVVLIRVCEIVPVRV